MERSLKKGVATYYMFNKMCFEGACQNRETILEMENLSLGSLKIKFQQALHYRD